MHKTISEIYDLFNLQRTVKISYREKFLELFFIEIEQTEPIILYWFILENGEEFVFPDGIEFLVEIDE